MELASPTVSDGLLVEAGECEAAITGDVWVGVGLWVGCGARGTGRGRRWCWCWGWVGEEVKAGGADDREGMWVSGGG